MKLFSLPCFIALGLVCGTARSSAEDMRIRAVDVDQALAQSSKVRKIQADIDSGKAVTGPQTARDPKREKYRDLLEEATDIRTKLGSPDLKPEKQTTLKERWAELKQEAKVMELELKLRSESERSAELASMRAKRKELIAEIVAVTERLAKEKGWKFVVFQYSRGDLPKTWVGDAKEVIWVTDQVVSAWNAESL